MAPDQDLQPDDTSKKPSDRLDLSKYPPEFIDAMNEAERKKALSLAERFAPWIAAKEIVNTFFVQDVFQKNERLGKVEAAEKKAIRGMLEQYTRIPIEENSSHAGLEQFIINIFRRSYDAAYKRGGVEAAKEWLRKIQLGVYEQGVTKMYHPAFSDFIPNNLFKKIDLNDVDHYLTGIWLIQKKESGAPEDFLYFARVLAKGFPDYDEERVDEIKTWINTTAKQMGPAYMEVVNKPSFLQKSKPIQEVAKAVELIESAPVKTSIKPAQSAGAIGRHKYDGEYTPEQLALIDWMVGPNAMKLYDAANHKPTSTAQTSDWGRLFWLLQYYKVFSINMNARMARDFFLARYNANPVVRTMDRAYPAWGNKPEDWKEEGYKTLLERYRTYLDLHPKTI